MSVQDINELTDAELEVVAGGSLNNEDDATTVMALMALLGGALTFAPMATIADVGILKPLDRPQKT
jgi:hypothetical protein